MKRTRKSWLTYFALLNAQSVGIVRARKIKKMASMNFFLVTPVIINSFSLLNCAILYYLTVVVIYLRFFFRPLILVKSWGFSLPLRLDCWTFARLPEVRVCVNPVHTCVACLFVGHESAVWGWQLSHRLGKSVPPSPFVPFPPSRILSEFP